MKNAIGKSRDLVAWALLAVVLVLALRALINFCFVERAFEFDFAQSVAGSVQASELLLAALIAGAVALIVTVGGSAPARAARLQLLFTVIGLGVLTVIGLLALIFTLAEDRATGLQKFVGLLLWLAAVFLAVVVGVGMIGLLGASELVRVRPSVYPGGYDQQPYNPAQYGQPGPYGQPSQFAQPSQYGSPGQYGQPQYGQPQYGQSPQHYGQGAQPEASRWGHTSQTAQPAPYGQQGGYGQGGQYGQPPSYGQQSQYGAPPAASGSYAQAPLYPDYSQPAPQQSQPGGWSPAPQPSPSTEPTSAPIWSEPSSEAAEPEESPIWAPPSEETTPVDSTASLPATELEAEAAEVDEGRADDEDAKRPPT